MKNLLRNIWEAPGSTAAGAIIAALGVFTAADVDLPKEWKLGLMAGAAFLAVFSGGKRRAQ